MTTAIGINVSLLSLSPSSERGGGYIPSAVMSALEHTEFSVAVLGALDIVMSVLNLKLTAANLLVLHPRVWIQQLKLGQS